MSEAQAAQRDDSPMDVDQPSPLEQDPAPLGMSQLHPFTATTVTDLVTLCFFCQF